MQTRAQTQALSNRAACHLRKEEYDKCVADCSSALQLLDPSGAYKTKLALRLLVRRGTGCARLLSFNLVARAVLCLPRCQVSHLRRLLFRALYCPVCPAPPWPGLRYVSAATGACRRLPTLLACSACLLVARLLRVLARVSVG